MEKGENTSYHSECGPRCPVEMVSWEDVQEFIRSLNERESGHSYRYRLPPEAEREYAARADTVEARYGELDEVAWYWDNSGRNPHPVGHKRANAWGLHDMLRQPDLFERSRRWLRDRSLRNKDFGVSGTLGGEWQPASDQGHDFGCRQRAREC